MKLRARVHQTKSNIFDKTKEATFRRLLS